VSRTSKLAWPAIGVLALALRIVAAAVRRPWHDEYFTAWISGLSWGDLLAALRLDSGPPLLYALVKLATGLGLDPVAAARGVAVLAGTAAVLVAGRAANRLAGPPAGLFAAGLLAVHPLAVAWSSEGRAYALLLLAAAVAWERLEALGRESGGVVGLAAAVALACWSHGLGLVLVVAALAAGLTLPQQARRRALLAIAAGVASFVAWMPVMAVQPPASVAWMSQAWSSLPAVEKVASPLLLSVPLAPFGDFLDLPSAAPLASVLAGLGLVALLAGARRRSPAWLLFGICAVALPAAAELGLPVYYPGRGAALWLAPLLGLGAAGAVASLPRRLLAAALAVAGLAVSTAALVEWARTPPRREEVVANALRHALPRGGTVVVSGYWWLDLTAVLPDGSAAWTVVAFPASGASHPGWYVDGLEKPAADEMDRLAVTLATHEQVAVVVTPGLSTAPVLDRIAGRAGLVSVLELPQARVLLRPLRSR